MISCAATPPINEATVCTSEAPYRNLMVRDSSATNNAMNDKEGHQNDQDDA